MNKVLKTIFTLAYKLKRKKELIRRYYLTKVVNNYHLVNFKAYGKDIKIFGDALITGHHSIEMGNNIHIGDNLLIRGEGGLKIGNNIRISRNFTLYTINHNYEGVALPYDSSYREKGVIIGNNVWIGMNVIVLPGAQIGDGVIVGAGTVVTGKVPPMAIIGSQRWKILKMRNEEHYNSFFKEETGEIR